MTKLAILDVKKRKLFDAPPRFKKDDRPLYFALTSELRQQIFNSLRSQIKSYCQIWCMDQATALSD